MAHGFTDFAHNEMLAWVLRDEAPSIGATLYFAAFRSGVEVSTSDWSDYARVAVTRNGTNFDAPANGDSANSVEVDFAAAATIVDTTEVDELRVFDAAAAGNLVWQGPLPSVKVINDGDPVKIPVGGADFQIAQTP